MKKINSWIALTLATGLLCGLLSGCSGANTEKKIGKNSDASASGAVLDPIDEIRTADSYDELYQILNSERTQYMEKIELNNDANFGTTTETTVAMSEESNGAHSVGTNLQISGYDEGDTVKTDGKYLYILGGADLKIILADGNESKLISDTTVTSGTDTYESTNALYVSGTVAVVITSAEYLNSESESYDYIDQCHAKLYDVSDPTNPTLLADLAQDGAYQDSRVTDGMLYLISAEYKYSMTEDDERSYVPCYWVNGEESEVALDHIYICPDFLTVGYSVVASIDMEKASLVDTYAFTGGSDTTYMDDTGLYLTRPLYREAKSEEYTKDQYSVIDYQNVVQTEIKRLTTDGGKLTLAATAYVDGSISDQYGMDVYDGNLRIATSSSSSSYSTYTDKTYGWTNYKYGDSASGNNVFILNEKLEQVGALTGFAAGETIYSVRFLGDSAYVVTYEQTDPLFTIDLADPSSPKIMDALEVTGVSNYLHMYEDGKLFGLGTSDDGTLKTAMFDVTDPENIHVASTLDLSDYTWSEAFYNHRAILVSQSDNIIGFPTDNGYVIIGYTGDKLAVRGIFTFDYYTSSTRGVIIGSNAYICDPQGLMVIPLSDGDLTQSKTMEFGVG